MNNIYTKLMKVAFATFLYNRKFLRNSYYIKMLQSLLPLRFHRFALKLKSARTKGDFRRFVLYYDIF